MAKTSVVTSRLREETASELDRLAERLDRSRGWVIARAVEKYVSVENELLDLLDEAEREIERGDYYTHEEMVAWIKSLRGSAAE